MNSMIAIPGRCAKKGDIAICLRGHSALFTRKSAMFPFFRIRDITTARRSRRCRTRFAPRFPG
jgi:hypothetical protein